MLPAHLLACPLATGDSERKICKAASLEVDVVCLDLEDAVAANRKAEARDTAAKVELAPPGLGAWARGFVAWAHAGASGLTSEKKALHAVLASVWRLAGARF